MKTNRIRFRVMSVMIVAAISFLMVAVPFNGMATSSYVTFTNFTEYGSNPVISPPVGGLEVKDPSLLYTGGWYYMAYTVVRANSSAYIAMSKSTDLHTWTNLGMVIGNNHSWSSFNTGAPFLMLDSNGRFYIYFQGENSTDYTWAIGVAVTDTINNHSSWVQYSGNPCFTGNWSESYVVYDPSVLKIDSTYYLYYISGIGGVRGVSMASSADKFNFTRYGRVVVPVSSYVTGPEAPNVLQLQKDLYICLMTDWNASILQITADVYSTDLVTWSTLAKTNTPFLTGLHTWDANGASSPCIIKDPVNANRLIMAYQGDSGGDTWTLGIATMNYRVHVLTTLPANVQPLIQLVILFTALVIAMPVIGFTLQAKDKGVKKEDFINLVIAVVVGLVMLVILIGILGSL